jgi:outer membrane protein OmpA-like peptidoglycan-associated protein
MATQTFQWENSKRGGFRIERWSWTMRWWLFVALVLAGLFHWWLYYFFNNIEFGRSMLPPAKEKARPERIAIDPRVMQEKAAIKEIPDIIAPSDQPVEPKVKADFQDIVDMLPEDKPIDLTPDVNKITNFLAPEPNMQANTPAMSPALAAVADSLPGPDIASAASAIKSSVLNKAVSTEQLIIPAKPLDRQLEGMDGKLLDQLNRQSQAGNAAAARMEGFSNLDDLVNRGNNLSASTAPILMPTDLLFEYGSDELADSARLSLMKLGLLIQRNPNHRFIIEGHTDTFGSDDFNIELSQRRANAVVNWLITSLRLSTDRIQAIGMGRSRLIAPGGTKEEQAINRRVEIKVRPLR